VADDTLLKPLVRGHCETVTWGEVAVGHIIREADHRMHTVMQDKRGWVQLKAALDESLKAVKRPAADTPVEIYVPSEDECFQLLYAELGAFFLRDMEQREHTITRQLMWRLAPVSGSAKDLRDHIDLIHGGTYVENLLYSYQAGVEKKDPPRKRAAIAELRKVHDELHSDPHMWPMAFPHHHAAID